MVTEKCGFQKHENHAPSPAGFDQRATPSTQKSARPAAGRLFVCRFPGSAAAAAAVTRVRVYVPAQCADSTLR